MSFIPHFKRAATVELKPANSAAGEFVVVEVATEVAVDPNLHAPADGFDNVFVPLAGFDKLFAAFLREQTASALFVEFAPPAGADVGLGIPSSRRPEVGHYGIVYRCSPRFGVSFTFSDNLKFSTAICDFKNVFFFQSGRLSNNLAVLDFPKPPRRRPNRSNPYR